MSTETKVELWKQIAGFEGLYTVSSLGRVRSYHVRGGRNNIRTSQGSQRILTPVVDTYGNLKVTLCKDKAHTSHFISRLVAASFLVVPPVYFLDGDKTNLAADNIGYCSRSESKRRTGGTGGGSGKLTTEQVGEIREKYAVRNVTYVDLAQEYGVGVPTISHIINRVTHK